MGLDARITNRLDNNNVQIEISNKKNEFKKSFSVPENKADSFIASYKKNNRNVSIISNIAFVASILGGVLLASACTHKLESKALKWILNTCGGIVGSIGAFVGTDKYIESKEKQLLNGHQAKEIVV